MERVVHKSHSYEDADRWDVEQQVAMTPVDRLRAAKALKDRAFPADSKDVRACHNNKENSARSKDLDDLDYLRRVKEG